MNNTVLKIIAGVLLAGAIVVAILGVRLSQQPPAPAPAPVASASAPVPQESVAVAARLIKAGQPITAKDVALKSMASPPALAYRQTQELIGKTATIDIPSGNTLTPSLFVVDSIASALRSGERAIAVQVDEVTGVGGFARPGDHVDVLWYLPANRETNDSSSSQVAIQNARLLTLGDTTVMDIDHEQKSASSEQKALSESGVKGAQESRERKMNLRSAVLAVPEADVTRLMIAASNGQLRLALRPAALRIADNTAPASPASTASAPALDKRIVTLSDFSPRPPPRKVPQAVEGEGVIIQEGSKERRLVRNEASTPQP